ncbi:hypothetical protein CBR_g37342 [Chara braunii]|uniref:DUF659 domain-containing protein n=1 Tax=Chara braunii TaxID=69332 RepID=A0A388JZQ9_CHABU|nr:hypothetical protein CBR_g37342 [Chara braunii]|eukprot:GBG63256.1 hypothetical protein CBR_g37342 [Chara braunii]
MADEGIRDTRSTTGGQRPRADEAERDEMQDFLDAQEGGEGGVGEAGMRDEAAGRCEPDLPEEEVVMTSRADGPAGRGARASRPELERARREKRKVGEEDVDVRDMARAHQTTIDELYAKEKLSEFTDVWLQWIYANGLPFNAFRGSEFQRVLQAAERVPRNVHFQFPSYRVTAGAGMPSQRGKVATMVSEVRAAFRHTGAIILSDGRKSRSGKPLMNFLAGGANGALLYATVAGDGSVADTADVMYRRWWAIILSFPAKDAIGFCTDSASNYTAARRFATDPDADIRRIAWLPCSTHVCNLMLSDVGTRVGWVKETIIRARALVRFIKSHGAAFALFRRMSPRVTLVEPVETRFASVFLMLTCLKGRRDALESMLHGDAWARVPWERRLVSQAQWVQQQIRDGEFWRCVDCAIRVMSPIHQLLRRMDRGGMMMFIVYEWSRHLLELTRRVDMPADMVEPCVREVAVRNLHMVEPAHAAAHLLNPRRRSLRYYESLQTTTDNARVVEECDRFLLAQTGGDPVGRLYRIRNWAQHERINTARRHKLGFAKLAQLVEIATNLKLAGCAQQGSGYVLPWVMGTGQEETAGGQEDDEGDVDPEVWGARPAGSFSEQDIERQVVAFHACRPSRDDPIQDVFGKRAVELRPWTDDDDAPVRGDATAKVVYFTYGGGLDGMTPHASVITDDVSSSGQASGTGRAGGHRRRRPRADEHVEEQEPLRGLQQTGRRWEVRSDNEPEGAKEEEEVRLRYRRFSPSHHRTTGPSEPTRPRTRSASAAERQQTPATEHYEGTGLADIPEMERTPSCAGVRHRSPSELRTDDFYVGGSGGGLGDLKTAEERDAQLDREEEERLRTLPRWKGRFAYMEKQRRLRELETGGGGGGDGGDVGFGGKADAGAARQGVPTGVEGDGVAVGGGGEGGGEDEDEDEEGSDHGDDHGDDGDDGDDDGDHDDDGGHGDDGGDGGGEREREGRLALVLRDSSVPSLPLTRPEAFAQAGFDADDLARLGSHDPFPHTGRRSGERRPPGGVDSPPPYIMDSPRWSGSSLSDIRGRESWPVDGGSGRRSEGGGSAGSMPPPPARSTEGGADVTTARAPVAGSPPPVASGVAGEWAAHRRVSDRMRADYDAGRGVFAGRLSPRFQVAGSNEVGSGRPSLHMAGRMLGLSRSSTRRVLIPPPISARGTAGDMQQGQHYTSDEEGLLMPRATRRHSAVTTQPPPNPRPTPTLLMSKLKYLVSHRLQWETMYLHFNT